MTDELLSGYGSGLRMAVWNVANLFDFGKEHAMQQIHDFHEQNDERSAATVLFAQWQPWLSLPIHLVAGVIQIRTGLSPSES